MHLNSMVAFRIAWALATAGWAGFIFYQSTRPAGDPGIPDLSDSTAYFGHAAVYGVLAFCAVTAVLSRRPAVVIAGWLSCAAFGLVLELYQGSVPGRATSGGDALANLAGAGFGALAGAVFLPLWQSLLTRTSRELQSES